MKSKPINLGFRNFTTACSHSNICIVLILDNKDRDLTAPSSFLLNVFRKTLSILFLERGSLFTADDYYNSVALINMLISDFGIYYLGTFRSRNGISFELPNIDNLTYGLDANGTSIHLPFRYIELNAAYTHNNTYWLYRCKDITKFTIITSHPLLKNDKAVIHGVKFNLSQPRTFGISREQARKITTKTMLSTCKQYNKIMGSVDIMDRLLMSYQIKRKSRILKIISIIIVLT